MSELPRLCPRCFVVGPEAACGACGGATQAFGTQSAGPLVVGRLRLLEGPPALDDLTASWPGPRRYPSPPHRPHPFPVLCRHRDGTMVWLWEAAWDTAFPDPEDIWVYRALAISDGLILEVPVATAPDFRAGYARRRGRDPLPELGTLLGELEAALDYLSHRLHRIALVHPDGEKGIGHQVVERLKPGYTQGIRPCADLRAALDWTLAGCPTTSRRPATGDAKDRPAGRIDIGLLDLGGTLARALLSRLHGHDFEGRAGHAVRLVAADPATPSADWRPGSPRGDLSARIRPVPPWSGTFAHRWRRRSRVRLAMATDKDMPVRVVAVGHNRLRGERDLAGLLDQDYTRPLGRLLLLYQEGYTDPDLLRWTQRELKATSRVVGGGDPDTDFDTLSYLVSHLRSG